MKQFTLIILSVIFANQCFAQVFRTKIETSVEIKIQNKPIKLYNNSYALIIGNSDYEIFNDLGGVKNDIFAIKDVLLAHGFEVTVKENLNKEQMDDAFMSFITQYGNDPENRLLFYYAGHGYSVKTNYGDIIGYLVPLGADDPNKREIAFMAKAIPMSRIEEYAKTIKSKHALFMFDACFSGSVFSISRAIPDIISYNTTLPVRQFITSGTETEQVPDVSIFCQQFIVALTSFEADFDKDGYLTGTELGKFVQTNVVNYSYNTQHPQYGKIRNPNLDKGDFVFELKQINENKQNSILIPGEENPKYGIVIIDSKLEGKLYLNEVYLGNIKANSKKNRIENQIAGHYILKLISNAEIISKEIEVQENRETHVEITSAKKTNRNKKFDNFTETANGVPFEMIAVQGGIFKIGNGENSGFETSPEYEIQIRDFYLAKTEVTFAEFDKFCEATNKTKPYDKTWGRGNMPVINVSWDDAKAYCEWLSKITGKKYRLPTEAEWEYAASAPKDLKNFGTLLGEKMKWPGTNEESELANFAWYEANSQSKTHIVATKKPNPLGIYDMCGNVREWCEDDWHENYQAGIPSDGSAWVDDPRGRTRVLRGGCIMVKAKYFGTTNRGFNYPMWKEYNIGFRIAMSF